MVARSLLKEQKYYTKEQLLNDTPSRRDGVDASTEAKVRKTYCRLIDAAGQKLKMPQWAIATATVFCHRFYAVKSLKANDRFLIPTACLFLAGKIDDSPRALHDVLVVCWEQKNKHKPEEVQKLRNQAFYNEMRELVLTAERGILYTRGFDLYVEHPYSPLTTILRENQLLPQCFPPGSVGRNLLQACWNFVNDSMKTTLSLQCKSDIIAKAIIYLSSKLLKMEHLLQPVLKEKTFAEHFEVDQVLIDDICSQLMDLYTFTDASGKKTTSKPVHHDNADSLSPLSTPAQGTISVPDAEANGTAEVVIKTEEACVEVGVSKEVSVNGHKVDGKGHTADVKQECTKIGENGVHTEKQVDSGKKRKALSDAVDLPEAKAVKVDG